MIIKQSQNCQHIDLVTAVIDCTWENIWLSDLEMVCLHTTVKEVLMGRKMQLSDKYSPPLFDHDFLVFIY